MNIYTAKTRKEILQEITPEYASDDHLLLLDIFKLEMAYRYDQQPDNDAEDFYENIHHCGLLLFCIAHLHDIDLMWEAKNLNMDMEDGFDIKFLLGSGVGKTIEYLNYSNDPEQEKILKYIKTCHESGDFEQLDEWKESKIKHFYG